MDSEVIVYSLLVLLVIALVYIIVLRQKVNNVVKREIQKTSERRASFVSIISHQLRTPLSIIKGYLEGLVTGDVGKLEPKQNEYLTEALNVNRQIIDMVNDYLEIANSDSDTLKVSIEPMQLEELVEEAVKKFATLARASNCIIEFIRPKQLLPKVSADIIKVRQVVDNIISNSIKYGSGENKATIELVQDRDKIQFSCQDKGVGIPEDQKAELFSKFFRANNILHKDVKGSGLGLYVAKVIIETLGGKIWIESEEGQGTKVSFTLPIINK